MSLVIGIDPGVKGALALLDSYGELLQVEDMPVINKKVSAKGVADVLGEWKVMMPDTIACVIEDVYSRPGQGVRSMFSFGRSKGVVEGAAATVGRLVYVTPTTWKRDMKVTNDKGRSRELATERWPNQSHLFKRVMDDGRAEAALIGLWHTIYGN